MISIELIILIQCRSINDFVSYGWKVNAKSSPNSHPWHEADITSWSVAAELFFTKDKLELRHTWWRFPPTLEHICKLEIQKITPTGSGLSCDWPSHGPCDRWEAEAFLGIFCGQPRPSLVLEGLGGGVGSQSLAHKEKLPPPLPQVP